MKAKINLKLISLSILVLLFTCFFTTKVALAVNLNLDYPTFGGIDINTNQDLNQIIAWFYYFTIGVSGFAAFFMSVWAGLKWSYSQGNTNTIQEAKDMLTSAALGILIILSTYLILQVINPDLTTLKLPDIHQ